MCLEDQDQIASLHENFLLNHLKLENPDKLKRYANVLVWVKFLSVGMRQTRWEIVSCEQFSLILKLVSHDWYLCDISNNISHLTCPYSTFVTGSGSNYSGGGVSFSQRLQKCPSVEPYNRNTLCSVKILNQEDGGGQCWQDYKGSYTERIMIWSVTE